MAKIIDFKTKKLLADLPTTLSLKTTRLYSHDDLKGSNVFIIANNAIKANEIFKAMKPKNKDKKAS